MGLGDGTKITCRYLLSKKADENGYAYLFRRIENASKSFLYIPDIITVEGESYIIKEILSNKDFWDEDISFLSEEVEKYVD